MPAQHKPRDADAAAAEVPEAPIRRSVGSLVLPHRRRWVVRIACATAVLALILATAILYMGGVGHHNPDGIVVVQGDPPHADAIVTVSGPMLSEPLSSPFTQGIDNRLRFHVPTGIYHVQITHHGSVIYFDNSVNVAQLPKLVDPWDVAKAATLPTSAPSKTGSAER